MTTQNAFHPQTAEFVATVTRNLPRVSGEIMQGWITNPAGLQEVLAHALCPEVEAPSLTLLERVSTITIPATSKKFVTPDQFMVNCPTTKVKVSYLGDNFRAWFLGKTEEPLPKQTLCYHKLRQPSLNTPIIAELGGEEKSETTLTEVYSLMTKQSNGKKGAFLTNGYANIFYIKDTSGVLRAVDVRWCGGGWGVRANSVESPHGWNAGDHVFSRQP